MRRITHDASRITLFALVLALSAGCPKRQTAAPPPATAEEALARGQADLEAGRCQRAEDEFTFTIFNFPGSVQASDAQYYLAESYFRSRDYVQAQTEYDFYVRSFPNGRFQEEAAYKLALAYLRSAPGSSRDQSRALKAGELLDEFMTNYPDSPLKPAAETARAEVEGRLAVKELDAARLYYKSGEYQSAITYYEYVLAAHPGARWPDLDRFRLAVAYQETGDTARARPLFEDLAAGGSESRLRELARARLARQR